MAELLEIGMMILFGLSWPINAMKSYKARSTKGKSILFLLFVFVGYILGISAKLLSENSKWYVLFFYVLNFLMVGLDMAIYFRNLRLEKASKR